MLTLKQLESFVRIVELGTFERAAHRLNTTPSTISKRIAELEEATALTLFDRSRRGAQLTEDGEQLLEHAMATVHQAQKILELKHQPAQLHRIRLGFTDLTALTWLPGFLATFTQQRPDVRLDITIDMSRTLYQLFQDGELDLVVIPADQEAFTQPGVESRLIDEVEMAFMARQGLVQESQPVELRALDGYTLISQGKRSGFAQQVNRWLHQQGTAGATLTTDNLLALVGLVTAGQGISVLPHRCVANLAGEDVLEVIDTAPSLPRIGYYAVFRDNSRLKLMETLAQHLTEAADFTQPFFLRASPDRER
ncbi:LysR family transcriptional regulator [Halomonas cupida]|uniref:DNA-binding transcriptional regulator, LysR family n=1 Tax=Halomonas cupida TaxID=44933 RepID=A0A1M7G9W1_9GAMM|nr:LysR family transcriptional regulator [Halomonas cupida]GEN23714.1 LysR family transcriptional regulator [Halomonas cupida]SHM13070.1 DNA-binding transcriptional regulator, LysR family [Halomonas cupida]